MFFVQRKKEYLQHCGVCKSKRLSDSVNYGILLLLLFFFTPSLFSKLFYYFIPGL